MVKTQTGGIANTFLLLTMSYNINKDSRVKILELDFNQ